MTYKCITIADRILNKTLMGTHFDAYLEVLVKDKAEEK